MQPHVSAQPEARRAESPGGSLPWVQVAPGVPYFAIETGESWTPIGQNDAITWPELRGLFRRRDVASAERYLALLARSGVTVLRLMLEYCHGEHRYFERPDGRIAPNMLQLWDDLFGLCERHGLRILLTPFDTFWMWTRWAKHPYHVSRGGPCESRSRWLTCPGVRQRIKRRLLFCTERWGGSGALFAWDLWNEIHACHGEDDAGNLMGFIDDVSTTLRSAEIQLHGRAHPQTVSVFGPHLESDPRIGEAIYRHPALDFASTHFYEHGTIDDPRDTVGAAASTGRLVREALAQTGETRPFFDSEHGPIHAFKDRHKTLPEPFDDEYFRHMQWAHFASGGAGGGMRWPNRHPHSLTSGMRHAQRALADFLPFIDWTTFRRRNLAVPIHGTAESVAAYGSGDTDQAIVWLLRTGTIGPGGLLRRDAAPVCVTVQVPGVAAGAYRVTAYDTELGKIEAILEPVSPGGVLRVETPPFVRDIALAIARAT